MIALRPATRSDTKTIFDWQTRPGARDHARDPRPPTWEGHCAWMDKVLADASRELMIIEVEGAPAGVVRLDAERADGSRELSILLDREYQSRGIGTAVLGLMAQHYPTTRLAAEVLPGNKASENAFIRAGFMPRGDGWFFREPTQGAAAQDGTKSR